MTVQRTDLRSRHECWKFYDGELDVVKAANSVIIEVEALAVVTEAATEVEEGLGVVVAVVSRAKVSDNPFPKSTRQKRL